MSDNQQFCLRWNNHQSTLVQVIDSLLSSDRLVDCTLAADGQYLHAHKVVLCACSPYFESLLSQHYEKHPIVILKDVRFEELKATMEYMYKGEVNINQDALGQFLKVAETLQIKGLTDGNIGDDKPSQKRHEPPQVRKPATHQSRSSVTLPPNSSGLTIEPSKRPLPSHLSDAQPDSPIRSREGSSSPTSRKRRRRRTSQGDEDGHQENSCDLPMQGQTMSITSVPSSIPTLPSGSSSTITKAPPPDDDSENPENDRLSGVPNEGFIKEKIEPQPELLLEPKTEYMEETNNDDSVEDLTLDDDDEYEGMMDSGPGPSHGGNNPNENYAPWQQITGDRQDDSYLNPADGGHRDSQGAAIVIDEKRDVQIIRCRRTRSSAGVSEKDFVRIEHGTIETVDDSATNSAAIAVASIAKMDKSTDCYSDSADSMKQYGKKRFTPFQVEKLRQAFEQSPYISTSQTAVIAKQIGLKRLQVRKWFSDYRCKIKRQSITVDGHCAIEYDDPATVTDDDRNGDAESDKEHDETDQWVPPPLEIVNSMTPSPPPPPPPSAPQPQPPVVISEPFVNVSPPVSASKPVLVRRGRKRLKKQTQPLTTVIIKRPKRTHASVASMSKANSHNAKRFTPFQVDALKHAFMQSPYIEPREAAIIARKVGLKKMQVRKWFCDYRCKMKKQAVRLMKANATASGDEEVDVPEHHMLAGGSIDEQSEGPIVAAAVVNGDEEEENGSDEQPAANAATINGAVTADIKQRDTPRTRLRQSKRTFRFNGDGGTSYTNNTSFIDDHDRTCLLRSILLQRAGRYLTSEELDEIASKFGLDVTECRSWFWQRGLRVAAGPLDTKTLLPLRLDLDWRDEDVTKPEFSDALVSVMRRSKNKTKFFLFLTYKQQITLLRNTEGGFVNSPGLAVRLAAELDVPLDRLTRWLRHQDKRVNMKMPEMTSKKETVLLKEWEKAKVLDESRLLMLAYVLDLCVSDVWLWYARKMSLSSSSPENDVDVHVGSVRIKTDDEVSAGSAQIGTDDDEVDLNGEEMWY